MEHKGTLYSIVIPCYNEALFIGQTLEALQSQEFSGKFEIIVVDNNCNDDTAAIARSFGVRVVSESRPGVCWARQAGTEVAKGEIVISTDADTIYPKDWLANIDRSFKNNSNCVTVAGPYVFDRPWWGTIYSKLLFGTISLIHKIFNKTVYIAAANTAFKKAAWSQYNTALTQGGDELALLQDLKQEGEVVFDMSNPVYTSGRRLTRGLVYNLFVTLFYYYFMSYFINKLFGKKLIGAYPAYRDNRPSQAHRWAYIYKTAFVVLLISMVHLPGHDTLWQQSYETFTYIKDKL